MNEYSHSRLSSYENCPRQFKYRYVDQIKVEGEGVEAFVGKRVHEILERLYHHVARFGKPPSLGQVLDRFRKDFASAWHDKVSIVRAENPRSFYEEHPTVVEDFVRAGLMSFYFAAENPEAAVDHAFELIDAGENQFFLARDHELFRWNTELEIIQTVTPEDFVIGQIDPERLGAEISTRVELGLFEEEPNWQDMYDADLVPTLYDEAGELIWIPMGS